MFTPSTTALPAEGIYRGNFALLAFVLTGQNDDLVAFFQFSSHIKAPLGRVK
jgi:hypothetical protein